MQRAAIQAFLDANWPNAQQMLDDTWHGIEIEKQMPDGTTVVGRLNADPKGALEMLHKFAKFCIPELGRIEHAGDQGGAIQVLIQKYGEG